MLRSLVRSRLPLPLIPLFGTLIIRAGHSGRVDWQGSDLQGVLAMVVYLAIIPTLSVLLAAGWFRGETGPWSWALARPIARWRWLGMTLLLDIATLAVSTAFAWLVIGDLPDRWLGPWPGDGMRELGYVGLLAIIHSSAAVGGARSSSAIGGALYAAMGIAIAMTIRGMASLTWELTTALGRNSSIRWQSLSRDFMSLLPYSFMRGEFDDLLALMVVLLTACACIIVMLRAGGSLPVRPRLSSTLVPLAIAAAIAGVLAPLVAVQTLRDLWDY
ncbi:MAG TPA: hypothetical protein VG755_35555 [Nannocystaceae bacterium]|nr:hypothetical protein [Nannocystaceae bacterium]